MSLGSPPPFANIRNDDLLASLRRLRLACAPILNNNLLPHLTDHTVDHADHVALLVDELIQPVQQSGHPLNDRELMVLYGSCYFARHRDAI